MALGRRTAYRLFRYLDRCLEWTADSLNFVFSRMSYFFFGGLLVILSVIPFVAPLLIGYLSRCVRVSADGRESLPGFERPAELYYDGLVVGFAVLEYLVISLLVFGITMVYAVQPLLESIGLQHNNLLVPLYLVFILGLFGALSINSWVHYSLTRDLWSIVNPVAVFSWVFLSPRMALKNFTISTLLALVLFLPGCLIFTLPWVLFAGLAASAFQRTRSYSAIPGEGDPTYDNTFGPWLALLPEPGKPRPAAIINPAEVPDFILRIGPGKVVIPVWILKVAADFALLRIEGTIRSLRYSLSSGQRLLWGGVIILFSFTLVPIPLLFGYVSRCIRESMNGAAVMPPFNNKRKMYWEGIKVSLICLEYMALAWLLFELTAPFIHIPDLDLFSGGISDIIHLGNHNRVLPSFVHAFLFAMMFNNAWLRYTITGDLKAAMNPVSMIRWILTYPEMIFNNMLSMGLIGVALLVPGLFLVTAPWVTFTGFVSNAYIRGESYHDMLRTGGIRKSWVVAEIAKKVPVPRSPRKG